MELAKESTRSHAPIVLMAAVLSAPVLALPDTGVWHGMRPFLIQAVAFGSLALMLTRVRWSVEGLRRFLTTGPNLALILFIGWTALSFALAAPAGGRGRAIALAELMRLASGAAIYFAIVYRCSSREHLKLAALLLLAGGVLASAAGMLSAGMSKSDGATGAYGNRQLLAAFLVLLLPVAIVFAQTGEKFIRPLFATTAALRCLLATVATVMLVATLLLTNNRSSWLGSVVGLLVITALLLRTRRRKERKHHWIASPVVAFACIVLFFILLGTESGVVERAKTLTAPTQVGSFQQRLQLWSICEEMIRERPLMGFGVGSFPMKAGDYSEALATRKDEQTVAASDADTIGVPSPAQVETEGASLSSLPHNEYLQLAAEQGLVGLALYLAVLAGFFYRGIKELPRLAKVGRTRKLMLIAAVGAIAAQCVDAIGNPGWHFGDVSPLFWLMMGIGMAATRTHRQKENSKVESWAPVLPPAGYGLGRFGWQTRSIVLGLTLVGSLCVGTVRGGAGTFVADYLPPFIPPIVVAEATKKKKCKNWTESGYTFSSGGGWELKEFGPDGDLLTMTLYVTSVNYRFEADVTVTCTCSETGETKSATGIREVTGSEALEFENRFMALANNATPGSVSKPTFKSIWEGIGKILGTGVKRAIPHVAILTADQTEEIKALAMTKVPGSASDGSWKGGKSPCLK